MRPIILSLFVLIVGAFQDACWAQDRQSDNSDAVRFWTYDLTQPCPASKALCQSWYVFRNANPWPYQTFGIDLKPETKDAVIVISEPPPGVPRAELHRLAKEAFGSDLIESWRLRWSTGVNGWLEDFVLRVRISSNEKALPVLSGSTFAKIDVPISLKEKLTGIYQRFYATRDGFYVDPIIDGGRIETKRGIRNLEVNPVDIRNWLSDPNLRWQSLDDLRQRELPWGKVVTASISTAFASKDGRLIALTLPKGVSLPTTKVAFRRFALTADLLVSAVRAKNGSLVLLGRARQLPFATLPPLRFETFASLAANKASELAQSYERRRLFAGKVESGEFRDWDWAPILLSTQLEDSEFGTLLNQSDQILKSWSEHGEVAYHSFGYKPPREFPFGELAASTYFAEKLRTDSLIFNLNTNGFAVVVEMPFGDVLTVADTGALFVLYEPQRQLKRRSTETDREFDLAIVPEKERIEVAKAAAMHAHQYFARQGDPILVAATRNVFLYQAVNNFLDVTNADDWRVNKESARTNATEKALYDAALAWLSGATSEAAPAREIDVKRQISVFLRRPGMTLERMAALLATPQRTQQELLRLKGTVQRLAARRGDLDRTLNELAKEETQAFEALCRETKRMGGTQNKNGCWTYPPICDTIVELGGRITDPVCSIEQRDADLPQIDLAAICNQVVSLGGERYNGSNGRPACRLTNRLDNDGTTDRSRDLKSDACARIRALGGSISTSTCEIEEKSGGTGSKPIQALCGEVVSLGGKQYQSSDGLPGCRLSASVPVSRELSILDTRVVTLRTELREIEDELSRIDKRLTITIKEFGRHSSDLFATDALRQDLTESAVFSVGLDNVLTSILAASEGLHSWRSIQTPTVVLSMNTQRSQMVGGHNIESEPTRFRPSRDLKAARMTVVNGNVLAMFPESEISQAPKVAQGLARGESIAEASRYPAEIRPKQISDALDESNSVEETPPSPYTFLAWQEEKPVISAIAAAPWLPRKGVLARYRDADHRVEVIAKTPPPDTQAIEPEELYSLLDSSSWEDLFFDGFPEQYIEKAFPVLMQKYGGSPHKKESSGSPTAVTRYSGDIEGLQSDRVYSVNLSASKTFHFSLRDDLVANLQKINLKDYSFAGVEVLTIERAQSEGILFADGRSTLAGTFEPKRATAPWIRVFARTSGDTVRAKNWFEKWLRTAHKQIQKVSTEAGTYFAIQRLVRRIPRDGHIDPDIGWQAQYANQPRTQTPRDSRPNFDTAKAAIDRDITAMVISIQDALSR